MTILLEKVDGVDYVESISLILRTYDDKKKILSELTISPEGSSDVEIPPYAIVCNGEHEISVGYI